MKLTTVLRNRLFLLTTVLPTTLALIYFGAIASDTYISESRFVVVNPERQTASPFGPMLKVAGFSENQDDAYFVQNYVLSRDALLSLNNKLTVKGHYSSPQIDRLSRFAGVDFDDSFEAFYRYYLKYVSVKLDPLSSLLTMSVRAYSPEEAVAINSHLLLLSEQLVNRLNERARSDLITTATNEVREAQKKDSEAMLALAAYRNAQRIIDPEKQAAIQIEQVGKLNEKLLDTRTEIQQLETLAKDSSQLPTLRQRAALLEHQIVAETNRMAGSTDSSLATKAVGYERLVQQKEFTAKLLVSSMTTLEQAITEARHKQLYLELVAAPSTPDSVEPSRIRNICVTFVLSLLVFGISSMLLAGIQEHRD